MQIVSLPVAASAVAPAGSADFRSSVFSAALVARGQMAPAGVLVVADESDSAIAGLGSVRKVQQKDGSWLVVW